MEPGYGREYEELYHRHWWWRSREAILLGEIRRLGLPADCRILDIGCGSGLFLPRLAELGEVWGLENDPDLLHADTPLRERIHTGTLAELAEQEAGSFDLITALDVLEHIEDDGAAASDMVRLLAGGGRLLITVPAFEVLWDHHDEINRHYRRYTRKTLRRLLEPRGRIVTLRYVFQAIFAVKLTVKLLNRGLGLEIAQHRMPSPGVNRAMGLLCRTEYRLLRRLPVPFGTSVMALLAK